MTPDSPDGVSVAEATVESLLGRVPDWIWNGEELPVPVDRIVANMFGLKVRLVEDMSKAPGCPDVPGDSISGLLLTASGEIWVNATEASQWEGRRRFTVGHELGHYVMHQDSAPRVFCRTDVIKEDAEPTTVPKAPIEVQADAFAAAMLMPMHLVRAQYEVHGRNVEKLQQIFGTSQKAMNYRLISLARRQTAS